MPWQTPKTDWLASDYYNFGDLDRVESNTKYIADTLNSVGYSFAFSYVLARTTAIIEFYDSLNRVEGNIADIAVGFYTPASGWETPKIDWESGKPFSYRDARRLERNLYELYLLVRALFGGMRPCGSFSCGEGRVLPYGLYTNNLA